MRKIYSLVVLLVALLTSSVVASAANVTFKTPDPSKVTIGWRQYYTERLTRSSGIPATLPTTCLMVILS